MQASLERLTAAVERSAFEIAELRHEQKLQFRRLSQLQAEFDSAIKKRPRAG